MKIRYELTEEELKDAVLLWMSARDNMEITDTPSAEIEVTHVSSSFGTAEGQDHKVVIAVSGSND